MIPTIWTFDSIDLIASAPRIQKATPHETIDPKLFGHKPEKLSINILIEVRRWEKKLIERIYFN